MEIWASLRRTASANLCLCMQGSGNLDITAEARVIAAWTGRGQLSHQQRICRQTTPGIYRWRSRIAELKS